jgi:NADH:ubiquinone oxidoreductase subunit 2 (subunit N)
MLTGSMAQLTLFGLLASAFVYGLNNWPTVMAFDTLTWDSLARFSSVLLCLSATASVCLALQSLKRFSRYEFLLLIWLTTLGMLCLIKCVNFLGFYLSIELQSLSSFMLAATKSRTEASAEAALKYFILSAFSSAILLLGMCLCYGAVGSLNFDDLALTSAHFNLHHLDQDKNLQLNQAQTQTQTQTDGFNPEKPPEFLPDAPDEPQNGPLKGQLEPQQTHIHYGHIQTQILLGLCCICVSLLFKLAAAPLHMWIADVYEGTMTAMTGFFAIASKIALATALIRVLHLIQPNAQNAVTLWTLATVSTASLLVGSLSAMRQVKLKRFMAFSGVANVGWFLLALVAGQWKLLVLHLVIYICQTITLFSIFITPLFRSQADLRYAQRQCKKDYGVDSFTIKYISDLNLMYKANPTVAAALIIAMFSFAGMPPLAGFFSKYLIINSLVQNQIYGLLAVALFVSVISAFYYIRVVKTVYFAPYTIQPVFSFGRTLSTLQARQVLSLPQVISCLESHREKEKQKEKHLWWLSFQVLPANAVLICWTTLFTICWFTKPNFVCVWLFLA